MNVKELRAIIADLPDDMPVMGYWEDEDFQYNIYMAAVEAYDPFGPIRRYYPGTRFPDPAKVLMLR